MEIDPFQTIAFDNIELDDTDHDARPTLVILRGEGQGTRFPIEEAVCEYVIGRAPEATFRIKSPDISRRHARVYLDAANRPRIQDLGSRNGTLVNGERIEDAALRDGDQIRLVSVVLGFENRGEQAEREKDLQQAALVQSAILPATDTYKAGAIEFAVSYRPAEHCGGDWWWFEADPDDGVQIALGDVMGHGSAPAMVATAVLGGIRSTPKQSGVLSLRKWFGVGNDSLRTCWDGQYWMAAGGIHLCPADGSLLFLNAGLPRAMVWQPTTGLKVISARGGGFLGNAEHAELGEQRLDLTQGGRVFLFTDGILEAADPNGQRLRLKELMKRLESLVECTVAEARDALAEFMDQFTGGTREDDHTFAIISYQPEAFDKAAAAQLPVQAPVEHFSREETTAPGQGETAPIGSSEAVESRPHTPTRKRFRFVSWLWSKLK